MGKSFKPLFANRRGSLPTAKEVSLDKEIRDWLKRKDLLTKAVRYLKEAEKEKVERLRQKWHQACIDASSYLLNSMQLKIMHMGGYSVWKQQQREKENSKKLASNDNLIEELSAFVEQDEFSNLSSFEQSDILEQLNEASKVTEDTDLDDSLNHSQDQLTMQEMYALMKLDYQLVFGE